MKTPTKIGRYQTPTAEFRFIAGQLALYGVNVIRTRLSAQGIHYRWATLRNKLGRWQRATTALTTTGGSRIELRCDIRPDPDAAATAKAAATPNAPETRIRRMAKP